jgi:UDP-N-acetylenolpyruvoylglucosamine reductase
VNVGGAKASDVLALVEIIKNEVLKKFGVNLEPEIKFIG